MPKDKNKQTESYIMQPKLKLYFMKGWLGKASSLQQEYGSMTCKILYEYMQNKPQKFWNSILWTDALKHHSTEAML